MSYLSTLNFPVLTKEMVSSTERPLLNGYYFIDLTNSDDLTFEIPSMSVEDERFWISPHPQLLYFTNGRHQNLNQDSNGITLPTYIIELDNDSFELGYLRDSQYHNTTGPAVFKTDKVIWNGKCFLFPSTNKRDVEYYILGKQYNDLNKFFYDCHLFNKKENIKKIILGTPL